MKEYLFKNIYKILLRKSGIWTKTTLFLCLLGSVNWDFTSYCCSQEHRIPSLLSSLMEGFFFFSQEKQDVSSFLSCPQMHVDETKSWAVQSKDGDPLLFNHTFETVALSWPRPGENAGTSIDLSPVHEVVFPYHTVTSLHWTLSS